MSGAYFRGLPSDLVPEAAYQLGRILLDRERFAREFDRPGELAEYIKELSGSKLLEEAQVRLATVIAQIEEEHDRPLGELSDAAVDRVLDRVSRELDEMTPEPEDEVPIAASQKLDVLRKEYPIGTVSIDPLGWYSSRETAELTSLSRSTIVAYLRSGRLQGRKAGPRGEWLVRGDRVQDLRAELGVAMAPSAEDPRRRER